MQLVDPQPQYSAMTHNNLGNALTSWHSARKGRKRRGLFATAVAAYKNAFAGKYRERLSKCVGAHNGESRTGLRGAGKLSNARQTYHALLRHYPGNKKLQTSINELSDKNYLA